MNVLTATDSDRISIGTMETVTGVDVSSGPDDAGKVVVLDADGKVDASMFPATITVSEANASGDVTITTAKTPTAPE